MPLDNEVNLRDVAMKLSKKVVAREGYTDQNDFTDKLMKVNLCITWDVIDIILMGLQHTRKDIVEAVTEYFTEEMKDLDKKIVIQ